MQFNVILNRKGEKILTINGYNETNNPNDGYELEDFDNKEDKTLFVNLKRLVDNQNDDQQTPDGDQRFEEYLTSNPYTRGIETFALRLSVAEQSKVLKRELIGSGAHASVYYAEYKSMPVALKEYDH